MNTDVKVIADGFVYAGSRHKTGVVISMPRTTARAMEALGKVSYDLGSPKLDEAEKPKKTKSATYKTKDMKPES